MNSGTWIHERNIQGKHWTTGYAESYYWVFFNYKFSLKIIKKACTTIMLIGSQVYNKVETIFSTLTLFVTVGMFAYILNNVSMILEAMNK